MVLQLPPSIVTPYDLARLELELIAFTDWFQHNAVKQEMHIAKGTAMPGLSPEAVLVLRSVADGQTNSLSQPAIDSLLASITDLKHTAPTMTITLAAPAGTQLKTEIATWCRQEIHAGVLLDFRFNATILGGMVVRCGSRVYDWSFRRAIVTNKGLFIKELRGV